MVDTLKGSVIHPDSVKLFNDKWVEINPEPRFRHDEEWVFDNLPPYFDVPFNDNDALLDLDQKTLYLQINQDDIDTIEIHYEKCLVIEALFNQENTKRPQDDKSEVGVSFYFKKQF